MSFIKQFTSKSSDGIATDSIILLFVKCLVAVVRIVQTMILSRALTKMEYGTYSQALLIISVIAPIFSLGLENAVNFYFNRAKSDHDCNGWINTIVALSLFFGTVGAICLVVFRSEIASYYRNAAIASLMIYIALRPCLQNLASIYQNLYVSAGLSRAIAVRNFMVALAQVLIIAMAAGFTHDLPLLFALLLGLDVVQIGTFALYFRVKKFSIVPWRIDREKIYPVLSYAVPLLLASSVNTLSSNVGRLLISGYMSLEDFALYSNMSQELPFGFVIASFTAVVTPAAVHLIAGKDMIRFEKLWGDYVELGYLVTWPLCIAGIIFAPQLISFLYSSAYLSTVGVAVFRVTLLCCALRFTYFGLVPTAVGQSRIVLIYSVLSLAISFPLTLILFSFMGMLGASLAVLIAMVISGILYFRRSATITKIPISCIMRPKKCLALVLQLLALGAGAALLCLVLDLSDFIALLVGFLVVAGGCYFLNLHEIAMLLHSMNNL